MIPQIEKEILKKIQYSDKFLNISKKYIYNKQDNPFFKKKEIINIFKEIGYPCKYIAGGAYVINREYNNYIFEYSFIISKNSVSIYIYIYINGEFIDKRVTNMGSILRYIPYDLVLADLINEKGFGLNSLDDLKNYIKDIIDLFNEFVQEYIKKMEENSKC